MSAESDAINRLAEIYDQAINSGDLNKWLETLTDDIVFMPPDQPIVNGKNAVRSWVRETFFDPFRMKLEHHFDELQVFGDTAYSYGRFWLTLSPKTGGPDTQMVGKFVDIFRRESDGAWKFARGIFNSDKPAR